MRRYLIIAVVASALAGAAGAYFRYTETLAANERFKRENQDIARRIYEIHAWHAEELPDYQNLPPEKLVASLLSKYSSASELKAVVDQARATRKPSPNLPEPLHVDWEDLIRVEPDLPGPTEQEKLTRGEKEYWAHIQRLRPLVWAFQRNAYRSAASAAAQWSVYALSAFVVVALAWLFVIMPATRWGWSLAMRCLSDLSRAFRGKYEPPN